MHVPVWHAKTRPHVEAGDLVVVGITQEQHPDRCRLFAQWKGFEFPILWDPFNTLGLDRVPVTTFVDEHGVVRMANARPQRFESVVVPEFLEASFDAPEDPVEPAPPWLTHTLHLEEDAPPPGSLRSARKAIANVLWFRGSRAAGARALDDLVRVLERRAAAEDAVPADRFRAGVARRLRLDGPAPRPDDFQRALDHWLAALAANPNQYVWRRRLQQWGPRLDKPYPFYDWVERAVEDVRARGQEPVPVAVRLSGAEVAEGSKALPRREELERPPDPRRAVTRDEEGYVRVETAAVQHTSVVGSGKPAPVKTARVHLTLRPSDGAHWAPDADPPVAWVVVPEGWQIAHSLHSFPLPPAGPKGEAPRGPAGIDFEVAPPAGPTASGTLRGYVLYSVCDDETGACLFRRQDFTIAVEPPEPQASRGEKR